jgi:hypothetical protein
LEERGGLRHNPEGANRTKGILPHAMTLPSRKA